MIWTVVFIILVLVLGCILFSVKDWGHRKGILPSNGACECIVKRTEFQYELSQLLSKYNAYIIPTTYVNGFGEHDTVGVVFGDCDLYIISSSKERGVLDSETSKCLVPIMDNKPESFDQFMQEIITSHRREICKTN